jgi:hypothetical protein
MRLLAVLLGFCLSACSDPDVGKACEKKEDCGEHLICDVHDGKGTCQEPHEDGEEGGSEEASAGTTDATTA